MIDASIPLQYRPAQIPDIGNMFAQSQEMKIRAQAAAQESQLRGLQIQSQQRQNAMADMDARDQLKLRQVYQQSGGDPDATIQGAIKSGVSPKNVQALQQHFADYAEKIAKTKSDELAPQKYVDDKILGVVDQASQLAQGDPQQYAAQWPGLYAAMAKLDPRVAQSGASPDHVPTADQLQQFKLGYATHDYFVTQETQKREAAAQKIAQQNADAATANAASSTSRTQAELPSLQAKSAMDQAKLAAFQKMTPADWQAQIDAVIPDKNSRLYKATTSEVFGHLNQGDFAGADQAIKDANDQQGRAETAVATAKAEAPTKVAEASAIAGATAGIQAKERARDEIVKSQDAVSSAQAVGDTIKGLLNSAQAGNSTAAAQIKVMLPELVNSVQGIKRLSGGQMDSTPGSALDKVQGYLSGITEGNPIPDRVAKELPGVIDQLTDTARRAHNAGVDSRNQAYGTNFGKIDAPKKMIRARDPQGNLHQAPEGTPLPSGWKLEQ